MLNYLNQSQYCRRNQIVSERDQLNSQAYMDVLDALSPSDPDNPVYMECYRFWRGIAGESHFDRYYCDSDRY